MISRSKDPAVSQDANTCTWTVEGRPRQALFLAGAVLVALLLRLAVVSVVYGNFLQPERDHWAFGFEMGRVANAVVQSHVFQSPYWGLSGPTAKIPPGYPYLLAGIFTVFGAYTKAAAIAVLSLGSLFSSLTCIPIFFIARSIAGPRAAGLAAWSWAFFPYAIYYSADSIWYYSLAALLLALLVWISLHLGSSTGIGEWAGFGALSGLAVLVNPAVLAVFPFLAGWACYQLHKRAQRWTVPAGACAFVFVLTLVPWQIRNYEVFHKPVFIRDDFWMEFYVGNVGNYAHRWNKSIHPSENAAELAEYQQAGELAYMADKKQQALAFVETHLGIFLWRSFRRAVYLWTGFWTLRSEYVFPAKLFDRLNVIFCTSLTILALAGLRNEFRLAKDKAILLSLVLLIFPGIYYITHTEMGYRQPIDPLIVILAAYGLVTAIESAIEKNREVTRLGIPSIEMEETQWAPKSNL